MLGDVYARAVFDVVVPARSGSPSRLAVLSPAVVIWRMRMALYLSFLASTAMEIACLGNRKRNKSSKLMQSLTSREISCKIYASRRNTI